MRRPARRQRVRESHQPIRTLIAVAAAAAVGLGLPGASHAQPQTVDEVRAEVEKLNHEAEAATERHNKALGDVKVAEDELGVIRDRIATQQAELDTLQGQMGELAAFAYRNSGVDQTLQLLTAEDPQRFLDQAATLDQLSGQQGDLLRQVQVTRQELDSTSALAEQKIAEIELVRDQLAAEQQEIETKLRTANALLARLTADQRASINSASEALPADIPASGRAKIAIEFALAQLGEPYRWGGAGPGSWDCSGLTMMAWRQAGVSLPHHAASQINYGTRVSKSELQPGDLVFFYSPISHNGMYLGDGKMIHAPHTGDVVKISSIDRLPFAGATRVG